MQINPLQVRINISGERNFFIIPVHAPFVDVSAHIIKSEFVGFFGSYIVGYICVFIGVFFFKPSDLCRVIATGINVVLGIQSINTNTAMSYLSTSFP